MTFCCSVRRGQRQVQPSLLPTRSLRCGRDSGRQSLVDKGCKKLIPSQDRNNQTLSFSTLLDRYPFPDHPVHVRLPQPGPKWVRPILLWSSIGLHSIVQLRWRWKIGQPRAADLHKVVCFSFLEPMYSVLHIDIIVSSCINFFVYRREHNNCR